MDHDIVRFGVFELDLTTRQLRKYGHVVRLQDKPFELLAVLVERAGQPVTRNELRIRLWPADTFVAFDLALNTAVRKVRDALGDSASSPRFVETLPKVGYRFVADVHRTADSMGEPAPAAQPLPTVSGDVVQRKRHSRRAIAAGIAAAGVLAAAVLMVVEFRRTPASRPLQFEIHAPEGTVFPAGSARVALSRDGRQLAFVAVSHPERRDVWARPLESAPAQRVAGTEYAWAPFWSPDGGSIAFTAYDTLRRIDLATGSVRTLAERVNGVGGAWSTSGEIVFGAMEGGLRVVSATGGPVRVLTIPDRAKGETLHAWPQLLPGDRQVLFLAVAGDSERNAVYAVPLDGGSPTLLLRGTLRAEFVPPDELLFVRDGTLQAVRFDPARLAVGEGTVRVAGPVATVAVSGYAGFSTARDGTLAYYGLRRPPLTRVAVLDRDGRPLGVVSDSDHFARLALSPDDRWLALERMDPDTRAPDIWTLDLSRGASSRLTANPANDEKPVWSADSTRLLYARHRGIHKPADLFAKGLNEAGEGSLVLAVDRSGHPTAWAPAAVMFERNDAHGGTDLWVARAGGTRDAAHPWVATEFSERHARVSSDGQWVAYASNASGAYEVYLRPLAGGDPVRVSAAGGAAPEWRPDGRELFFVGADFRLMSVPFGGARLSAGAVQARFALRRLVGVPYWDVSYAPAADGRRIYLLEAVDDGVDPVIHVLMNRPRALVAPR